MKNEILVIGAGAWGTAIANLLAENSGKKIFFVDNFTNRKIVISKNIKNKLIINRHQIKDVKLKKRNKILRIIKNLHQFK